MDQILKLAVALLFSLPFCLSSFSAHILYRNLAHTHTHHPCCIASIATVTHRPL